MINCSKISSYYYVSECFGRFNSSPLQFMAQHFGCAMRAYFRNNGMQALAINGDPSKETMAHWQMSSSSRRPSCRISLEKMDCFGYCIEREP